MLPWRLTRLLNFWGVDAVPGFDGRAAGYPNHFVPELLGLRGVGILIVVMGHLLQRIDRFFLIKPIAALPEAFFSIFSTPFTGCRLLFCLSGYTLLLSIGYARNLLVRHIILFHLIRRIVRLWMPYFLVLASTFAFLNVTGYQPLGTNQYHVPPTSLTVSLLASLTFTHDLLFGTFPRLFPPGWFIETLVQFHVIGPVILLCYLKIPRRITRMYIGFFVLLLISAAALFNLQYGPPGLQHSIVSFMPYFWTGAILADMQLTNEDHLLRRALRSRPYVGWLGLAAFVLLGAPLGNDTLQLTAQIICLFFIVSASFVAGASFQCAMVGRWLTRIGVASYAIFLVHLQVLQIVVPFIINQLHITHIFLAILVCGSVGLCAVMLVAAAFYWLAERPFVATARHIAVNAA